MVTRGAVAAEGVEGGFSAAYRVLSAFEDSGQARRGYVVEGLGAAQFAMDGAVDRLRAVATARDRAEAHPSPRALVLAAADPANAYGAALPWPEPPEGAGHRPGRKAGSLVVVVDGELTLYMERGGKTLLAWPRRTRRTPRSRRRRRPWRTRHAGAPSARSRWSGQRRLGTDLGAGPGPGDGGIPRHAQRAADARLSLAASAPRCGPGAVRRPPCGARRPA